MTIPLTALADKFTDAVWEAMPSADILPLDNVLQAGTTLQRLAQGLAPLVPGGIAIADQDVQHLVSSYVDYSLPPPERSESLTAWSVKRLLEHNPGLHAEDLQHLAQDMETITAAVRETARRRASPGVRGSAGKRRSTALRLPVVGKHRPSSSGQVPRLSSPTTAHFPKTISRCIFRQSHAGAPPAGTPASHASCGARVARRRVVVSTGPRPPGRCAV